MRIDRDRKYLLGAILLLTIITIFPFIYLQEDVTMRIHDNMDSNIVWIKMLLDNNMCWAAPDAIIEQVMNGIPRSSLYPAYDLSLLIFWFLGAFWGYAFNKLLMAIIAFIGMYLLLQKCILPKDSPIYISIVVSILFSLLPFWSFSGSIAGVPLVLWAFLNLRQRDRRAVNWLILVFYGFYSSLVLTGFFLLLAMSFVFLYDLIKERRLNLYLLGGLALLSITYIISHYPIFYMHFMAPEYISHRSVMKIPDTAMGFKMHFLHALTTGGTSHLLIIQMPVILPLACLTLCLMIIKKQINKTFVLVLGGILACTFLVALLEQEKVKAMIEVLYANTFPLNLARLNWLVPPLWYILMALSFAILLKCYPKFKYAIIVLAVIQLFFIMKKTNEIAPLSYKDFYSQEQFAEIKNHIDDNQADYRVISIGMPPAVSQYNGFYTLDAYLGDYPLSYKQAWGEVIERELEKAPYYYYLFNDWGSHCYAFSSQVNSRNTPPEEKLSTITLDYDFEKLKQLAQNKPVYILSLADIDSAELIFQQEFENPEWIWDIYLYKVK